MLSPRRDESERQKKVRTRTCLLWNAIIPKVSAWSAFLLRMIVREKPALRSAFISTSLGVSRW